MKRQQLNPSRPTTRTNRPPRRTSQIARLSGLMLTVLSILSLSSPGRAQQQELPPVVSGTPKQVWSPEFDRFDRLGRNTLLDVDYSTGLTTLNTGTPGVHKCGSWTRLGYSGEYEMTGACIPDGAGGDGVIAVFESMREGVDDQAAGGTIVTP